MAGCSEQSADIDTRTDRQTDTHIYIHTYTHTHTHTHEYARRAVRSLQRPERSAGPENFFGQSFQPETWTGREPRLCSKGPAQARRAYHSIHMLYMHSYMWMYVCVCVCAQRVHSAHRHSIVAAVLQFILRQSVLVSRIRVHAHTRAERARERARACARRPPPPSLVVFAVTLLYPETICAAQKKEKKKKSRCTPPPARRPPSLLWTPGGKTVKLFFFACFWSLAPDGHWWWVWGQWRAEMDNKLETFQRRGARRAGMCVLWSGREMDVYANVWCTSLEKKPLQISDVGRGVRFVFLLVVVVIVVVLSFCRCCLGLPG